MVSLKKMKCQNYKIDNSKIISKRYTILIASTNKKPIFALICEKGMRTNNFIYFMSIVKNMVDKNSYFLMDNASTHKSKLFQKYKKDNNLEVVYNAPYHSEYNKTIKQFIKKVLFLNIYLFFVYLLYKILKLINNFKIYILRYII